MTTRHTHTLDQLEATMVSALRAEPALKAQVAKLLESAYMKSLSEAEEDSAGAVLSSEAGDTREPNKSKAFAKITAVTTEHVVFRLPKGWPVTVGDSGRCYVMMPLCGMARPVAKKLVKDEVLKSAIDRNIPVNSKAVAAWMDKHGFLDNVEKAVGTKFQPISKADDTSKAGESESKSTSKAGESEKVSAKPKSLSSAEKKRLRRIADHTQVVPKELPDYKPQPCTCRETFDCKAVREFGQVNKLRQQS